ncbi:GNAT family N-acetyltransferase [Flavobacterium azooxidireducens]|uniref:GNAT family N-acetyltransferase n=1 Tax=Flavobacterium azooxidireducens TaxID=1871076 RepID=A0ABY4KI77_9FLAO|nr:GNAT family N-acetyltransferase [Flavobacterium azooxidireducens]UPQ80525.1 GNAT family N-acetyltransferase [Flavobacterium azooxidireducens]
MTKINRLEWDSDFFNLEVGEIVINSSNKIELGDFDLVYVKSTEKTTIELNGFEKTHSETKVVYFKNLVNLNPIDSQVIELSETNYSIKELNQLAFESGNHSRFKLDNRIENRKFEELYELWVKNSINKSFADEVFVNLHETIIAGFVSYKVVDDYATIGLIAVSKEFQGIGIGKQLLCKVENELIKKGIYELRIPTQEENYQACGFYEKLGYKKFETTNISHYWRK